MVNCSKNLPANIFTCNYWKGYLIPNQQENGCSFQFLKRFCVCSAHFLFLLKKPSDELSIHKYLMSPLFCYYIIFSCICNDGILPLSLLHCALPCIEKNLCFIKAASFACTERKITSKYETLVQERQRLGTFEIDFTMQPKVGGAFSNITFSRTLISNGTPISLLSSTFLRGHCNKSEPLW